MECPFQNREIPVPVSIQIQQNRQEENDDETKADDNSQNHHDVPFHNFILTKGLLKKAASGVLAIFPCSRITHTLRASKWLRPCWTNFFEPTRSL
jgi:hypothetical protein